MEIYTIANWITGFIEAFVSFILFETFLKRRKKVSKYLYCCAILSITAFINISNFLCENTILNFFITVVLSLFVSYLYCGTLKMRLLSVLLSFMLSMAGEMIVLLCLSIAFNQNVNSIVGNGILRIAGIAISKALGFLGAKYISHRAKHEFELLDTNYWILFAIMFASSTIVMGMFYMILEVGVSNYIRNMIMVCTLAICIITVIMIYLYENTLKQQIQMSNQQLSQMQLKNQIRHYNTIIMSQNQIKSIRHDLKNHLLSIYAKLNKKEYIQCQQYVSKMLDNVKISSTFEFDTGNTVLDAILSAKKDEAEKKNISFNTNLRIPHNLPICEDDICIIFGNALDNAIEACEKVEYDPYIEILMSYDSDSLVCKIENSCVDDFPVITTKKDIKNHGIGRLNIEKSLNNYECVFNIEHGRNKYILSFVLMELNYI